MTGTDGRTTALAVRGRRGRRVWRGGFTLVEMLIALAAVALLAVGIAEIFRVTGETVASGRRLSTLTSYAGALERQLRSDVASMSREGFLVIRHGGADANGDGVFDPGTLELPGPDSVQVHPEDDQPRPRRTDSMVFFASGEFSTLREPLDPRRLARSTLARVYYGHGQRQDPDDPAYLAPVQVDDDNRAARPLGERGERGEFSPNRYASDWGLLRHVLLLRAESRTSEAPAAAPAGVPNTPAALEDMTLQAALQPAVRSVYRRVNELQAAQAGGFSTSLRPGTVPNLASGVVDITTSPLSEIMAGLTGYPLPTGLTSAAAPVLATFETGDPEGVAVRERMQAWMVESFPADEDAGRRIRFELAPPNYLGLPDPEGQTPWHRTDQMMLTASVFAPRCTEFIVEWTFGQIETNPTSPALGRMIWYGAPRVIDVDRDGTFDAGIDYRVQPYGTGGFPRLGVTVERRDGSARLHVIDPGLIHVGSAANAVYSCFGPFDPVYEPQASGTLTGRRPDGSTGPVPALMVDVNGNGLYEPSLGDVLREPETVAWPWPVLLRVTMTLADAQDPSIEQTFQFTLPVPRAPARSPR